MFRCGLAGILLIAIPLAAASESPYAGEEGRPIKALSAQQVKDLLDGKGMGYALAAELNGYPGPLHVIDLEEELSLDEEQREETRALFERMRIEAMSLGRDIVEAEAELDRGFAAGKIDEQEVLSLTSRIAALRGRLRAVHLNAHLEQARLLSAEQVEAYARLRGYRGGSGPGHRHSHHGSRDIR